MNKLAAMLAEHDEADMPEMGEPAEGMESEFEDEADEGQMVAVEEIMQAFEERNPRALLDALRSFMHMSN